MESAPSRIACLQPSATVILDALGALDRVVACTRYCADVVERVADGSRTILADSWTADAQQIISARADLVIAAVPYQEKAVAEILKAGIRFLGLAPKNLSDIYTDIAAISGIIGRPDRGDQLIGHMKKTLDDVRARVAHRERPRVFCEEWGKPIIASQTWVAELIQTAGGHLITTPGRTVTADEVAKSDPEIIFAAWCGAGERVPLEKIIAERAWNQTSAAKRGRIFCIRDEFLNTPAPTLLCGLNAVAWALHPDLFSRPPGIRQITAVPSSTGQKRRAVS